uniref:Regulation of nuclear pre-mRNA domain-containing protein 2 n=1 Tax=Culicoides sonorensis TaxID=179676 RepID=A0A336MKE7_CULSO
MGTEKDFDVEGFEKKLKNLKDTQEGIQGLSAWCLLNHVHHKKIVTAWLNVLKQVKVEHRLVLFYLANDVVQHSKRKNYDFVESWGTALQRATTMVRDDKVKHKILRIFKIWGERQVYNEEFLADLNGLLSVTLPKPKQKDIDPDDFQISTVVNSIQQCVKLQAETDKYLKLINKLPAPKLPGTFKDRAHCKEVVKKIDEDVKKHEKHLYSLKAEIKARTVLVAALQQADEFYQTQRGEVKVVANAYKNFGNRIKNLKKKLDELTSNLPSPIPSPPINAPSPGPDTDFDLPMQQFTGFSSNGFVSYMEGSALPFDPMDFNRKTPSPHINPIQVINSNKNDGQNPNNNLNDFFKTLIPNEYDPGSNMNLSFNDYSLSSNTSFSGVPPPAPPYAPITMSTYGMAGGNAPGFVRNNYTTQQQQQDNGVSNSNLVPPPPLPPLIESSQNFNNWDTNWNAQDRNPMSNNPLLETPHSPPHYERNSVTSTAPVEYVDMENSLGSLDAAGTDVDHRSLTDILQSRVGDVDHRNLISLTGSPGNSSSVKDHNDKKHSKEDLQQQFLNNIPPPAPTITEENPSKDYDLRQVSLDLQPILQDASFGNIAKILEMTNKNQETGETPRKKQKGDNGDEQQFGSEDMEMSDEDELQQTLNNNSNDQNNSAPPGFDTDQYNENGADDMQNTDDWNSPNVSGNYSLIGQRLMQLANESNANSVQTPPPPPPGGFLRPPLMSLTPGRPSFQQPPHGMFNQGPPPPPPHHQGYPSPMYRGRGGRGFRGGPNQRGHNHFRGGHNNFRGMPRGRW